LLIFDDKPRDRREPMREGERLFDFYDTCAVDTFVTYRALVNEWVSEMPTADAAKLINDMRKGSNAQFKSALCELIVHRMLHRLGYLVEIHPRLAHTTNQPDFLAKDTKGRPLCYVEATATHFANAETSQANREAQLYNAIDLKARLPSGFVLGYSLEQTGAASPKSTWFAAEIGKWARQNAEEARQKELGASFERDGWRVEVTLHQCSHKPKSAIGISSGGARWLAPEIELRNALDEKGSKYGDLGAPYLIVVADARGEVMSSHDVSEALTVALLGYEVNPERLDAAGMDQSPLIRESGFWFGRGHPDNVHVSAVLFMPDAEITQLRRSERGGIVAQNPWAKYPLSPDFLPLQQLRALDNQWRHVEGAKTADVLGIPLGWPPDRVWRE